MMKSIRALFFVFLILSAGGQVSAQMLDDLFDDDDFLSTEVDKMQKKNAAKKAAEESKNAPQKPASAPASPSPAPAPVQAKAPAASSVSPASPAQQGAPAPQTSPVYSTPRTFALPVKQTAIQAAPSLPAIGAGKTGSMPNLGSKKDENLSLFEMRARKTGTTNTNVLNFDIAGVKLRMTPEEVLEKAGEAGFSVKFQDWKIPEIKEWKYHRQCLQQMFFTSDHKRNCIRNAAQNDQNEYIRRLVFENKQQRETLSAEFTSMFTKNQAYRIRYVSKGDHSLGQTEEALYLKSRRRREFLQLLTKKYGSPDDERELLWGISGYNAVLQASISDTFQDISLVMEDHSMEENDLDASFMDDVNTGALNKFSF